MIFWKQGGRRGALLLVLSWSANAQISVINGLAHFHPCGSRGHGEILVHNSLDTSVTILLEVEHMGGSPKFPSLRSGSSTLGNGAPFPINGLRPIVAHSAHALGSIPCTPLRSPASVDGPFKLNYAMWFPSTEVA